MLARQIGVRDALRSYGIPRRKFLKFCASMTAALGLPASAAAQVAATLEKKRRPVLVWLEFQDCAGNTESMLRSSHPSITELVLSFFSLEYHETIMAAAGKQAENALERVVREEAGKYVAVVEGSIPTAHPAYCTIGGRSAMDIARHVCGGAAAVIAVGS
jgi:hydrogenase small subunit